MAELGVAASQILYELSWEDVKKHVLTLESVLMASQRNCPIKSLDEAPSLLGHLKEHCWISGRALPKAHLDVGVKS